MLERNCSVGKGRRASGADGLGEFASALDERVERCGGGKEPFLIGVAGGTASGKTTVCDLIMHNLQEKRVVLIRAGLLLPRPDPRGTRQRLLVQLRPPGRHRRPGARLHAQISAPPQPRRGSRLRFVTHSRVEETISVEPADVIIIEGILVLAMQEVRDLCHMKIFVDTDDDLASRGD